jgi:hypothetical protein
MKIKIQNGFIIIIIDKNSFYENILISKIRKMNVVQAKTQANILAINTPNREKHKWSQICSI